MADAPPTEEVEAVLIVPPNLTKSAYATLIKHNLVPQRWHLEGRYGSRTHRVDYAPPPLTSTSTAIVTAEPASHVCGDGDDNVGDSQPKKKKARRSHYDYSMGLPLLSSAAPHLEQFIKMCADNCGQEHDTTHPSLLLHVLPDDVKELLSHKNNNGSVSIRYYVVPRPKSIPKVEDTDATIHPERAISLSHFNPTTFCTTNRCGSQSLFTYAELFSGIGGFGVALNALGGKCIFASEIDATCRQIYARNIDIIDADAGTDDAADTDKSDDTNSGKVMHSLHGDITAVPDEALPEPNTLDLLTGGFPCQPFSSLGAQPGFDDERGLLYKQILRVLRYSRPRAFLLENVPGILTKENSCETILLELRAVGYDVHVQVVSSRGLTAQSRKRVFFVGLLRGNQNEVGNNGSEFLFPYIPDLGIRAGDILHYRASTAAADNDDGKCCILDDLHSELYRLTAAQMDQLRTKSKRWKPSKLAWADKVCDTLDGHYGNSVGKGHSQLVPCAAPLLPRQFTVRECARLMGFPTDYALPGHDGGGNDHREGLAQQRQQGKRAFIKERYKMFGNAVCPPVVAAISGSILACIKTLNQERDWRVFGIEVAISLALDAILKDKRDLVWNNFLKREQLTKGGSVN